MKSKTYEIAIVVVVLFLLAACFGCKDKAEAHEPNEPELEYRETNGIPICPYCQKPTERTGGYGLVTLLYYEPVYDVNGINTNPDRNTMTMSWECQECGNDYTTSGNAYDGYSYCGKFDIVIEESEPNEPDYSWFHPIADPNWEYSTCSECGTKIHITETHYCPNYILRIIPTWPDYIELKKKLIIGHEEWINPIDGSKTEWNGIVLTKGTKIYFKEDKKEIAMNLQMQVIWPDVFVDPNYEYPDEKQKERVIADGLMGWGLCYAGNEKPENFGMGMVKIDRIIDEIATPENLMRLSKED